MIKLLDWWKPIQSKNKYIMIAENCYQHSPVMFAVRIYLSRYWLHLNIRLTVRILAQFQHPPEPPSSSSGVLWICRKKYAPMNTSETNSLIYRLCRSDDRNSSVTLLRTVSAPHDLWTRLRRLLLCFIVLFLSFVMLVSVYYDWTIKFTSCALHLCNVNTLWQCIGL